ncbi:class I SAM-dependent DNA methyltransferase [Actibacterium sp. D379-3]
MTTPDKTTIAVYDARADEYADRNMPAAVAARLADFIAALPPGGAALDLGCGPGWAAAAMRDAGLRVTAMDASAEMARVARERHGLAVTVAPFSALDAVAAFDGIWAHFSLLHAPRADFPGHLAALHRALKPGGQLLLGMKLGQGTARDRLNRFYTYYSLEELHRLVAQAGFTITGDTREVVPGFEGTPSPSITLRAHA